MTRRYRLSATPSPRGDWRALAADRPQRPLDLPVHTSADTVPDPMDEHDVELVLRCHGNDRPVVTLVAAVTITDAAKLRALATRLQAAADALEASRDAGHSSVS